mgnify:CR=1 FL=1
MHFTFGIFLTALSILFFEDLSKGKRKDLRKPRPHQLDAIDAVEAGLKTNDRGQVIMACGTGKTDVGFWYYRKQNPNLALVLVPSIALVKQIRSDWLSQITNDVVTFQLCSSKDTSKRDDEYIIESSWQY